MKIGILNRQNLRNEGDKMSILRNHQKSNIRFQSEDIILFEPTVEFREELFKIISDQTVINDNGEVTGEVGLQLIKTIIRESSNIGAEIDEISDEEFEMLLENGDRVLTLFLREIGRLVEEIAEEISYRYQEQLKMMNTILNSINNSKTLEELDKKLNKVLKKYNVESLDELTKKLS